MNSRKSVIAVMIAVCTFVILVTSSVSITLAATNRTYIPATAENGTDGYSERYMRLDEVFLRLMNEYYTEVDANVLIQGAIDGMMASLNDPYTFYYTPAEMTTTTEEHDGNYVGIGIQVTTEEDGRLCVTRVFKGGPAYEAGLLKGDRIIESNGCQLQAFTADELTEAVSHIKGPEGSFAEITVDRNGEMLPFTVECRSVVQTRAEYYMLDDEVGYIILYEFFGDAAEAMEDAMTFMQENGAKSIVIDLRNNTGGQLDICLKICNMFLPEGVIVYTEDRYGEQEYYYSDGEYYDIPITVLVNRLTASASEIFSAAVQDYGRGIIVGETTFGKGIVQTWYQFPIDGAGMQLTTSTYFTPNGRCIHKTGVEPDIPVSADGLLPAASEEANQNNDDTIKAAYEYLKGLTND